MPLPEIQLPTKRDGFRAVSTISLGELYESNVFDWSMVELDWSNYAYSEEQFKRVCNLFIAKNFIREIGMLPILDWYRELKARFILASLKYNDMYKAAEDGSWNPMIAGDSYTKQRIVGSDFAASQISPQNQDYASNANDLESETIQTISPINNFNQIQAFKSIDELFIDEVGAGMFYLLYTESINGY